MVVTIDDLPAQAIRRQPEQRIEQITCGVDPAMFRGEPRTPEWVQDLAGFRE